MNSAAPHGSTQSIDEFHAELRTENAKAFRWPIFLSVVAYLAWVGFDYVLAPADWVLFSVLRVIAASIVLSSQLFVWFFRASKLVDVLLWVGLSVFGVFIVPMMFVVEQYFLAYVLGFTLIVFAVPLLANWSPRWSVSNLLTLVLCPALAGLWFEPRASGADLVAAAFFVATAFVFSLVMSVAKYYSARSHFFTRVKLQEAQLVSERLRAADQLKDEFLANVSHELRTPLAAIIGLSESMLESATVQASAAARESLHMIALSGKRLANLVNDILDFEKLKNHQIQLNRRAVDVRGIIQLVVAMLTPLAVKKDISLLADVEKELPPAWVDDARLEQILMNLVGNAIKFTERGSVTVRARTQGGVLQLSVVDTGPGIPVDKRDVIFERFQQVDNTVDRSASGTGLGLAITKTLVELHEGTISVQSTLGRGSEFLVCLPLSSVPASVSASASSTALSSGHSAAASVEVALPVVATVPESSTPTRVLVVDDEPINLHVVANFLRLSGYAIEFARSGEEALQRVQDRLPNILLLDVMMPKMSGIDLLRHLRMQYSLSELPVVLLTAKTQTSDLVAGFEAGANDYIAKPFSKAELLARVRTQLNLSQITNAYSRFVPRQFLKHLRHKSVLDMKVGDHVQREMSVMFSDIRSFTELSEELNPRENFNFLNSFLGRIAPVIGNNLGFIDKYLGDGVMSLFPNSVDDAVKGAAELREALRKYNVHRNMSGYRPIVLGTGIHIGPLIMGTIGYEERMQTTVISDSVNLASRLEGLTKFFKVETILSEAVVSRLSGATTKVRSLGRIRVKGKRESVNVYELLEGAVPEEFDERMKTLPRFQEGVASLAANDVTAAIDCFSSVVKQSRSDTAAEVLLDRAVAMSRSPSHHIGGADLIDRRL